MSVNLKTNIINNLILINKINYAKDQQLKSFFNY